VFRHHLYYGCHSSISQTNFLLYLCRQVLENFFFHFQSKLCSVHWKLFRKKKLWPQNGKTIKFLQDIILLGPEAVFKVKRRGLDPMLELAMISSYLIVDNKDPLSSQTTSKADECFPPQVLKYGETTNRKKESRGMGREVVRAEFIS